MWGHMLKGSSAGSDPPDGYADSHTSDDVSLIAEHLSWRFRSSRVGGSPSFF